MTPLGECEQSSKLNAAGIAPSTKRTLAGTERDRENLEPQLVHEIVFEKCNEITTAVYWKLWTV